MSSPDTTPTGAGDAASVASAPGGVQPPTPSHTSATPAPQVTAAPDATATPAPAPVSIDALIDSIPPDRLASLSDADMDLLLANDPAAIKRITGRDAAAPAAAAPAPSPGNDAALAGDTPPEAPAPGKPVKRVWLGHLSPADQAAIASIVFAFRDGKATNVHEAIKAAGLSPAAATAAASAVAVASPEPDPADSPAGDNAAATAPEAVNAEVATIQARIDKLNADIEAAESEYDNPTARKLTLELAREERKLERAQEKADAETRAAEAFTAQERDFILHAQDLYAEALEDPVFAEAMADARELAGVRGDPILLTPDWPMKLAQRVHAKVYGQAAPQAPSVAKPPVPTVQARPMGAVAAPSGGAEPVMSKREAFAAIDAMDSEAAVDAAIRALKAAEAQKRAA